MKPGEIALSVILALSLLAIPFPSAAQQPVKVGLLFLGAPEAKASAHAAVFREGLRERGWIEGGNLLLEYGTR